MAWQTEGRSAKNGQRFGRERRGKETSIKSGEGVKGPIRGHCIFVWCLPPGRATPGLAGSQSLPIWVSLPSLPSLPRHSSQLLRLCQDRQDRAAKIRREMPRNLTEGQDRQDRQDPPRHAKTRQGAPSHAVRRTEWGLTRPRELIPPRANHEKPILTLPRRQVTSKKIPRLPPRKNLYHVGF